jgi:predicted nucleic acid-binding protein
LSCIGCGYKGKAQVIVTNNKKDFPSDYLERFEIKVLSADEFLENIIELNPDVCLVAF